MSSAPAKQGRAGLWLRIGGTVLTVALIAWLLQKQGWASIAAALAMIAPWQLALAMALTFLSRLAVVLRWHVLLRAAGEPVTLSNSTRLTFAGLFASNFLPTTVGGDVVRLAGAVQLRFDAAASAASLVVDRLVGMAGMATLLPIGLARLIQSGLDFSTLSLSAAFFRHDKVQKLRALFSRLARKFVDSLKLSLRHPRSLIVAYLYTLLYMAFKFTAIWLMLRGMGQAVSWWTVAGLWSMVYFITLIPISMNGYGLQEIAVTVLYPQLGGISLEASLAVALLIRTMEMAASLPGALFVPGILAAQRQSGQGAASAVK